jgi:drug/metabolite transporter (DMT)-like permease
MRPLPRPEPAVSSRRLAFLLLFLITLVSGLQWPVIKSGLHELPPFTYAALRIGAALPVVLLVLAPRRQLRRPPWADLPIVLVVGLLQIGLAIMLANLALQVVPAGRSSILVYTSPVWAALGLRLFFGIAIGRRQVAGIAIGILGIGILINPTVLDWSNPGEIVGSLALVGCAVIAAAVVLVVRHHRWHATPLQLLPWQLAVAFVPIALLAVALDGGRPFHPTIAAVGYVLYSGPLATGFVIWAGQTIARSLGPILTTMGMLATPVVGFVASSIFLGERISPVDVLAFAVTIAGIAVVLRASSDQSPARVLVAPDELGAG